MAGFRIFRRVQVRVNFFVGQIPAEFDSRGTCWIVGFWVFGLEADTCSIDGGSRAFLRGPFY